MSFPVAVCAFQRRTVAGAWVSRSDSAGFRWRLGLLAAPRPQEQWRPLPSCKEGLGAPVVQGVVRIERSEAGHTFIG